MKMLIVEDDAFYSQFISELVEERGVMTVPARTAEDALQEDVESYDGVIIDVMLPNNPELSGISPEESRGGFCAGVCVARRLLKRKSALLIVLLTSGVSGSEAEQWALKHSVPFVRKDEGTAALMKTLDLLGFCGVTSTPLAFIVHGHDENTLLQLKDYIQNVLKWQEPLVLRDQPSNGKTIIEKFEEYAFRVDCVFVLMTPDDMALGPSNEERRRSRQNVVFELGFFYGSLGRTRGRILVLHKGPQELPSDIAGIVWIDIGNGIKAAGEEIRNELATALPHR